MTVRGPSAVACALPWPFEAKALVYQLGALKGEISDAHARLFAAPAGCSVQERYTKEHGVLRAQAAEQRRRFPGVAAYGQ